MIRHMMKYQKSCRVCKAIHKDPTIKTRIYRTSFYVKREKTTLMDIYKEYSDLFTYVGLTNHVKKHQFMNESEFEKRSMVTLKRQAALQATREVVKASQIWSSVIEKGHEMIEDGSIKLRANDILRAAKDQTDFDFKQKNNEIAMMAMVMHYASGESEINNAYSRRFVEAKVNSARHPASEITGDTAGGEGEQSPIHNGTAGYAAPLWPSSLPGGNSTAQDS